MQATCANRVLEISLEGVSLFLGPGRLDLLTNLPRSTSSIWLLEHVCCRLPRAGRRLLPFRIAMARECPRCVPCGSSLGHEGSQDEAHKKRHASLNAPHLLLFPGPLSKHSGCQERPIRHPCSASPDTPEMRRALSCAPAAACCT